MKIITQRLEEIMNSLSSLEADWMDDTLLAECCST